jgi:hypothetical protein
MNLNKAFFVGKVEGQPQITDNQGTKRAFFTFVVNNRVQGENGQWVNSPVRIPIYADDRKANLIEQYVVEDHQLLLECEYQNWMDNNQLQHTFKLLNVSFGYKPRQESDPVAVNTPMAPPAQ